MSFFLTFTLVPVFFHLNVPLLCRNLVFTPQCGTVAYFISMLTIPDYWLEIYLDIQTLGLTKMLIASTFNCNFFSFCKNI